MPAVTSPWRPNNFSVDICQSLLQQFPAMAWQGTRREAHGPASFPRSNVKHFCIGYTMVCKLRRKNQLLVTQGSPLFCCNNSGTLPCLRQEASISSSSTQHCRTLPTKIQAASPWPGSDCGMCPFKESSTVSSARDQMPHSCSDRNCASSCKQDKYPKPDKSGHGTLHLHTDLVQRAFTRESLES